MLLQPVQLHRQIISIHPKDCSFLVAILAAACAAAKAPAVAFSALRVAASAAAFAASLVLAGLELGKNCSCKFFKSSKLEMFPEAIGIPFADSQVQDPSISSGITQGLDDLEFPEDSGFSGFFFSSFFSSSFLLHLLLAAENPLD